MTSKRNKILSFNDVLEISKTLEFPEIIVYNRDTVEYIALMNDGNGDDDEIYGVMTKETLNLLRDKNKIGSNIYHGFHFHMIFPIINAAI